MYVKLPDEDKMEGDEHMCGELRVSMYGTRDAAMNWATEYGETLKQAGFVQGKHSACLFYHEAKEVAVMVHGDDFVAVGDPKHLAETEAILAKKYKIKVERLGPDDGDMKEVKILNKIVRITTEGIELETDPRHAELIVRELGLEGCKATTVPGSKAAKERPISRVIKPSKKAEIMAIGEAASEGEMREREVEDEWTHRGVDGVWRRRHQAERRALFTPCGTSGSPPRPPGLLGKRITEGEYVESGEKFIVVDDWRDKRTAHRRLDGVWTGTTTFEVDMSRGSTRSRIPCAEEAAASGAS